MGCPSQVRLTITGSTKDANPCGCGKIYDNKFNPIGECNEAVIGPRPKRQNVRQQLHDYILAKLGAPAIEIELDEQQIDLAIDEALDVWDDYAPHDFYQYYTFAALPGQSVYQLPPFVGHVRNVFYKQMAEFAFQASDLGGSIPVEFFFFRAEVTHQSKAA